MAARKTDDASDDFLADVRKAAANVRFQAHRRAGSRSYLVTDTATGEVVSTHLSSSAAIKAALTLNAGAA